MLLSRPLKLLVLGFGLFAAGCDRQSGKEAQPQASASAPAAGGIDRSHKGSAMPEFKLTDPKGKALVLSSLKGKPLLINLWATWCAPCVAELPQLDKLAASGRIRVLTINQDSEGTDKISGFLKDHGIKVLEPWIEPAGEVSKHYDAQEYPISVLYDAQGHEVWRVNGPKDWGSAETEKLLGEAG